MSPAATIDLVDRYPVPFPDDLPTIELRKISIDELLSTDDKDTSRKLFDTLTAEGFFYLDLRSSGRGHGLDFWHSANELHDAARDVFHNVSVEEKETYVGNPLQGEWDRGYRAAAKDDQGQPRVYEVLNVPSNDLLNNLCSQLPPWLSPYQPAYKCFAQHASEIGQALLHHLETPLGLAPDTLASLHSSSKATGGFVRMLHYPVPGAPILEPTSPPHTDGNAVTILFNWQGGLQIARPRQRSLAAVVDDNAGHEWLWVRPLPGFALVNIGDPLVVFTNGLLRSGLHRVVVPPGEQAKFDRYSVLAGLRPRGDTKMRALRSEVIPEETEEQKAEEAVTAEQWVARKVRGIMERAGKVK